MNREIESLRLWLQSVAPGAAKPLDTKYNLVTKLATHYGATPVYNDLLVPLIAKLAVALDATPERHDEENNLWFKIAEKLSASPKRGDVDAILLAKIASV